MSTSHSITYKGFEFEFNYNFSKGCPATHEEPEEYDEYEIYNITLNGIDATDLLNCQIYDFEDECITNLQSYNN